MIALVWRLICARASACLVTSSSASSTTCRFVRSCRSFVRWLADICSLQINDVENSQQTCRTWRSCIISTRIWKTGYRAYLQVVLLRAICASEHTSAFLLVALCAGEASAVPRTAGAGADRTRARETRAQALHAEHRGAEAGQLRGLGLRRRRAEQDVRRGRQVAARTHRAGGCQVAAPAAQQGMRFETCLRGTG